MMVHSNEIDFEGIKNVQEHFDNREQIGIYTQKVNDSIVKTRQFNGVKCQKFIKMFKNY